MNTQRGFTLIELMAASAATAIVILATSAFMLKALSWYDELSAKIEINRHARETYDTIALGGRSSSTGNDGTKNLYGLRGRFSAPSSGLRQNYALRYRSNNLTLMPDSFAAMSVPCTAAGQPLPDCADGSSIKSVQGWLGDDIQINNSSRSVAGRTVEVTIALTDPFQAQRAKSPSQFSQTYRAIFTLNREEGDP